MKRKLLGLILCTLIISACDRIMSTPIGDILQAPREYVGKEVTISGNVMEKFSFVIIKYFVIQDETGGIIVITDKPMPAKGEKLMVKGIFNDAFSIGDQELFVLVECR